MSPHSVGRGEGSELQLASGVFFFEKIGDLSIIVSRSCSMSWRIAQVPPTSTFPLFPAAHERAPHYYRIPKLVKRIASESTLTLSSFMPR